MQGLRAAGASNNADALSTIEQELPNVVLSNVNRPDGNGIEFIQTLRKRWTERELPVIFMTGRPSVATATQALEAGAFHYMTKPISAEDLLGTIYKALKWKQDPVVALIHARVEEVGVDYKRSVDLSDKRNRAELARDMIAMANSGGGTIIVGVAEARGGFELRGVTNARDLDPTKIGDAVRPYIGSNVKFSSRPVLAEGVTNVAISVQPAEGTVALAKKANQEAGLYTGRIYIRTTDARTAELTDPTQLAELLERVIEQRQRRLLSIFKR